MDEGRAIFEWWMKEHDRIEREAKANGTWVTYGLDCNNHLFKAIDEEAKEKLAKLKKVALSKKIIYSQTSTNFA